MLQILGFKIAKYISYKRRRYTFNNAYFNTENPQECGIVIVDDKGKVINYKEKSSVSEGILRTEQCLCLDELIVWVANYAPNAKDFCADIVPKLIGRINTWHTNDVYIDIGTSKSLDRANKVLGGC